MVHTYDIAGMHCQGCVRKVAEALRKVQGINSVEVTLQPPRARVEMSGHVDTRLLNDALKGAGDYQLSETAASPPAETTGMDVAPRENLFPLLLIIAYIAGTVGLIALVTRDYSLHALMGHFMAGFFLVFSFFKFLDLRGFADAYRSYDVLAKALPIWGWVYPFAELALGIAYVAGFNPLVTNVVTMALMLLGSMGVLRALLDKKAIRCACLGTVLKLPMTTVTLVEDLGMAVMAAIMLVLILT